MELYYALNISYTPGSIVLYQRSDTSVKSTNISLRSGDLERCDGLLMQHEVCNIEHLRK